ncbi:hypothetical protein TNCT_597241 [Trichonephila clavata]|uniref:Uncharacterized protein n=1 Tax=Trichonephila clavata TaxID=2740835 RepID=A0A8X6KG96_TRICU|nr:hypothetical protein TNCT_597241 [Trichonephila clavata]
MAYHPASNSIIELWHHKLKECYKVFGNGKIGRLPAVVLRIGCSLKEDLKLSAAEPVVGNTLCLLGEFFRSNTRNFWMPAQASFIKFT